MRLSRRLVGPLLTSVAVAVLATGCGGGSDGPPAATAAGSTTAPSPAGAVDASLFTDGDQVVAAGSGAPADTTYRIGRSNIRARTPEAQRVHTCLVRDPRFKALDPEFSGYVVTGADETQATEWSTYTFAPKTPGASDQQVLIGYAAEDPGDVVSTWYQTWNADVGVVDGGEADTNYIGAANVVNAMVVGYSGLEDGGADTQAALDRANRCTPNSSWDRAVPRPETTPGAGSTGYDIDGPTSSLKDSTPG